ncbi:hypothetical protein SLS58_004891 [Diplodia intermedia]|uniref:Nuclear pore protein n=1 Tax=Diplodia intermedia TaxID=856260 RepID=A0ABR3TTE2_9PEZI
MPDSNENDAISASSHPQTLPDISYFDDDGDLRILVYDEDVQKVFVASSKAMSFVCNPWKRMLAGDFKEAQADPSGMKEISLPEDDPRALSILLNIAHLRFDNLPKGRMSFEAFRDLIVLSNKYCATVILKPWLSTWVQVISGSYYFDYTCGREELLFIYWELGEEDGMEELARELTWDIGINEDGQFANKAGKALNPEDSYCCYPPGLLGKEFLSLLESLSTNLHPDSMLRLRAQTISCMLDELYGYVSRYRTAYDQGNPRALCKSGNSTRSRRACDSLMFGSLMLSLQCAGLSFERPNTESITWSMDTLFDKIMDIEISQFPRESGYDDEISQFPRGSGYDDHSNCNFYKGFRKSIKKIRKKMASPVLKSHRVHMERQKELLG